MTTAKMSDEEVVRRAWERVEVLDDGTVRFGAKTRYTRFACIADVRSYTETMLEETRQILNG